MRAGAMCLCAWVLCAAMALTACGEGNDEVANSLSAFVTDSRLKMVVMSATFEAFPVALFKDGSALTDTAALLFPAGLTAHQAQFPDAWTEWREKGDDVELLRKDGTWKLLKSTNVEPLVSSDVRLAGKYESGSAGFSLTMSIVVSNSYTFTDDGTISSGSYQSGNISPDSNVGVGVGVVTSAAGAPARYTINGYRLTISRDDGSQEEHVIVVCKNPTFIYIDGALYAKADT